MARSRLLLVAALAIAVMPSLSPARAADQLCPETVTPAGDFPWMPTESEWTLARARAQSMSIEELAGASLVVQYRGRNNKRSNKQSAYNLRVLGKKQPSRALPGLAPAGVILFRDNARTARQAYWEAKAFGLVTDPLFFTSVDQEGPPIVRLTKDIQPPVPASKIGKLADIKVAKENGFQSGRQLRAAGIDVVYAPVADVKNPKTPRSLRPRLLSYNSQVVGEMVSAQVTGYNEQGVLAVIKHFPGIGSIPVDTHRRIGTYPYSIERLCTYDLAPFRVAITRGVAGIMVGHGVYPMWSDNPASGSRKIVTELLRNEMKFSGVIFTDSMTMKAAAAHLKPHENIYIRALSSGVDLILMPGNPQQTKQRIAAALTSGKLDVSERRESVARVIAFRTAQMRVAASLPTYKPGSTKLLKDAQWFAYEVGR